ncbi:hypothetical protein JTB14_023608 [Gonioctena quinquepunctata]|nr:hypothetical protein JTB14_023608 [Gonioctena quinquepunctata]
MMSFRNFWRIKEVENCAVCILKPCFDSAVWLIPYRGYCEHSEKYYSSKAHFQEIKDCYWMYCIAALIIVALIWNCFYILGICAEDSVVCILLITDELSGIYGVSLYLTILINARYHMAATNIMCDIMDEKCWLDSSDRKHFRLTYIIGNIILCLSNLMILYILFLHIQIYGINYWTISKLIVTMSGIIELTINTVLIQQNRLNINLLKNQIMMLKKDLQEISPSSMLIGSIKRNIDSHIRITRKIKMIYVNFNKFFDTGFLIFMMTSTCILIINIYIFVTPWEDNLLFEIRLLQLRTLLLIIALIVNISASDLHDEVSLIYQIISSVIIIMKDVYEVSIVESDISD